jgi:dipeptidyl aminopeptidase/acylaminoacyl peptidase
MTKRWRLAFMGLSLLVAVDAGAATAKPSASRLPPILDRELLFGDPEISGAQLSPDGAYMAFIKPLKGTRNIWVKRIEEPFEKARAITADTKRPIPGYFWSRDSKYVLFVQDQGGDENYNVYAVNPADAVPKDAEVPPARNLTDAKGVRAFIYQVPRTDPDTIYVGINERDKAWHDLYKVTISTGQRTLLRENTDRITGWVFDLQDKLRLATRSAENGDTEVLRVDEGALVKIHSCGVFETCTPVRFHKDGQRVYLTTNKGADVNLVRLTLLSVGGDKEEAVETDPDNRVDLAGPVFSDLTDELIATRYVEDKTRYYWKDKAYEADYQLLQQKLPGQELGLVSSTRDERLYLVFARSDVEPGEMYLFDRGSKKLTPQYHLREKLVRAHLAEMKPIRYPSSDGLEIPAYLTLPKGVEPKALPLILLPHGGPWARDGWGFQSLTQFLANRGYAVLQPNFRGSTGYGKKLLDAGNLQWGEKMQDDLTWGVKHLVSAGVADPKRVGILGGSYGGYATLAGLAFTPDLYAAGVSIVGPSNLLTLLESIPPYWEPVRKLFYMRMGDPTTAEGKARLQKQSPLHSAGKIKASLLVIQGANDPRVKKAESDQIVIALRDRGFPVEYLVADNEGHGFAHPVNNMASFFAAERFLAKHLGGRYQEDATTAVVSRLKEITVDPKSVQMPKNIDQASVGVPRPSGGLAIGTVNYKARIEMAGNTMDMAVSSDVKTEGDTWVLTDTLQTPSGPVTDRTVVAKDTLVVRSRSIAQGPMTIDLALKDGKATGEMKMNGQARPIAIEIGGDVFADGAGSSLVLATLPLVEGYSTTYRNLDLRGQKVKAMELKVSGIERVTVPAGTFDAFKVEVSSADDGSRATHWIAREARKVVKTVAVSPQMGGATITSELQP